MNPRCFYPDWEGGLIAGRHIFDNKGFCIICGEVKVYTKEEIASWIDNEGFEYWLTQFFHPEYIEDADVRYWFALARVALEDTVEKARKVAQEKGYML